MIKHFCDICNQELTKENEPKHHISFKYIDTNETRLFTEFCRDCSEELGHKLIDILDKHGKRF